MDLIFIIVSVAVPLLLYFTTPVVIRRHKNDMPTDNHLLFIASILFFIAWYLPSPPIAGQNTAFTTHFVGGGLFTGFYWLYLKRNLKLNLSLFFEVMSLYLLVSGLGVLNELFELTVVQLGIVDIPANDTWWDLLSNSLGVLIFWISYRAIKSKQKAMKG